MKINSSYVEILNIDDLLFYLLTKNSDLFDDGLEAAMAEYQGKQIEKISKNIN